MDIVSSCIARDLKVYACTFRQLRRFFPDEDIYVIVPKSDVPKFLEACGPELNILCEDEILESVTFANVRNFNRSFFPMAAGWYFQQFLKWGFVEFGDQSSDYLIWDADTVLLKPLELYSPGGKRLHTKASEHHQPYFETFKSLLGQSADRDFSFISQHQIISRKILRELMSKIEERSVTGASWPLAILEGMKGEGSNLFSEYETYGHYEKAFHREEVEYRDLSWMREGRSLCSFPPSESALAELENGECVFAAFEASHDPKRVFVRQLKTFLRSLIGK